MAIVSGGGLKRKACVMALQFIQYSNRNNFFKSKTPFSRYSNCYGGIVSFAREWSEAIMTRQRAVATVKKDEFASWNRNGIARCYDRLYAIFLHNGVSPLCCCYYKCVFCGRPILLRCFVFACYAFILYLNILFHFFGHFVNVFKHFVCSRVLPDYFKHLVALSASFPLFVLLVFVPFCLHSSAYSSPILAFLHAEDSTIPTSLRRLRARFSSYSSLERALPLCRNIIWNMNRWNL